jgi:hypothetical protein
MAAAMQFLMRFPYDLRPGDRVRVDRIGVHGRVVLDGGRTGVVQFLRSDLFERAYSHPRGVVRYCVVMDDTRGVEPWVDRRFITAEVET